MCQPIIGQTTNEVVHQVHLRISLYHIVVVNNVNILFSSFKKNIYHVPADSSAPERENFIFLKKNIYHVQANTYST